MKTTPMKFISLFTASVVIVGGFLAFPQSEAKAEGERTFRVFHMGTYVTNLCVKNVTKGREACTGKIGVELNPRDLTIPWDQGDKVEFWNKVVGGTDRKYGPIADRDTHCWSEGMIINTQAYCRMAPEIPRGHL